jgi:hypothetical protein
MSQPGRRVPQVIIMTMVIGLLTSFPLFLALMYFMTDLEAVRTSPLPSMEIMFQAYVFHQGNSHQPRSSRHRRMANLFLLQNRKPQCDHLPDSMVGSLLHE